MRENTDALRPFFVVLFLFFGSTNLTAEKKSERCCKIGRYITEKQLTTLPAKLGMTLSQKQFTKMEGTFDNNPL